MNTKSDEVLRIFNTIAPVYDLVNHIMSFGLHLSWKKYAINSLNINKGDKVLDLCCGSGDMTGLLIKKDPYNIKVTAVDFSPEMLKIAETRFKSHPEIKFIQADAMHLPFEDNSFNHVVISFGLRNLENIPDGLKEINRVLKRNGSYVSIDFGKPCNPIARGIFLMYFHYMVPALGLLLRKFPQYAYLPDSIDKFPDPKNLLKYMESAGFNQNTNKDLFFGFVAVQKGIK